MGEYGISLDGPCLAMTYFGIAQDYAGKNLTPNQVIGLLNDPKVYTEDKGANIAAIGAALDKLGVDSSKLNITDERKSNVADPSATAIIRIVKAPFSSTGHHFQQGTVGKLSEFKWDPIYGTTDTKQTVIAVRNVYITPKKDGEK
jgi:hypothetical protein